MSLLDQETYLKLNKIDDAEDPYDAMFRQVEIEEGTAVPDLVILSTDRNTASRVHVFDYNSVPSYSEREPKMMHALNNESDYNWAPKFHREWGEAEIDAEFTPGFYGNNYDEEVVRDFAEVIYGMNEDPEYELDKIEEITQ
jgi:hypothetical protein